MNCFLLGKGYEILPYMINKKLTRKKKQPDFVLNGESVQAKISADVGNDWFFLKICREGKFLAAVKQPTAFCRYLHHSNPYLKMGPFKEEKLSTLPYAVIFQDILTEKEMEFLKTTSAPQLSRTRVSYFSSHI